MKVAAGSLKDVEVPAFLIGQYPVTVYEYGVYLERTGAARPENWDEQSQHLSRPVTRVNWEEAGAYCNWADGRLPTDSEWEFAASIHGSAPGDEPRVFPWGDDKPTPEHANYTETRLGSPTPVGLFPVGATPAAIFDMAGNVWEWSEGGNRLRGAGFFNGARDLRAAFRNDSHPDYGRSGNIGFRCAREVFP